MTKVCHRLMCCGRRIIHSTPTTGESVWRSLFYIGEHDKFVIDMKQTTPVFHADIFGQLNDPDSVVISLDRLRQ